MPRVGFTIVEVVLVLVIVGALAGIAIPHYANFVSRQRVEAAARRIVVDMSFARRHAKFASENQKVKFELAFHRYILSDLPDPDHPAGEEYTVEVSEEPYRATIISADFGGDTEIIFNGYGLPDSDGSVVIAVGSHQRTITVDAQTGRASVLQ